MVEVLGRERERERSFVMGRDVCLALMLARSQILVV